MAVRCNALIPSCVTLLPFYHCHYCTVEHTRSTPTAQCEGSPREFFILVSFEASKIFFLSVEIRFYANCEVFPASYWIVY